jgi:hypothetical protein
MFAYSAAIDFEDSYSEDARFSHQHANGRASLHRAMFACHRALLDAHKQGVAVKQLDIGMPVDPDAPGRSHASK